MKLAQIQIIKSDVAGSNSANTNTNPGPFLILTLMN